MKKDIVNIFRLIYQYWRKIIYNRVHKYSDRCRNTQTIVINRKIF